MGFIERLTSDDFLEIGVKTQFTVPTAFPSSATMALTRPPWGHDPLSSAVVFAVHPRCAAAPWARFSVLGAAD